MTSAQIRQQFLDFFQSKGHHIVPSAPIVVKNDPTLLFTNAGMNQFKDYFLGNKKPDFTRIADTQKCLRVSGKHNDLEEVGVDTYHHTMFEMLGNWSFGDYFKKEAIAWSWELLTEVYKIDKEKLYVTIFEGDEKEGLPRDDEAYNEWKKWISEDRILLGKKKDNFWEMGDTGPCGPCTEIHVDTRPNSNNDAHDLVNNDDTGMVMEIWNNVFIQYNRLKDGTLESLPAKHVDTGMGFERLVRVLQNKTSNYDTDVFTGTIEAVEKITNKKYIASLHPSEGGTLETSMSKSSDDIEDAAKALSFGEGLGEVKQSIAFRVLADHIRAISFTIADGQLPSNTGAGYVIRRILRRAVRYYYSYLDYKQPLLFQLLPLLAKQFENVFPELNKQKDFVEKVVKEEEESFLRTLEKGLKRFDDFYKAKINESIQPTFNKYNEPEFPIDPFSEMQQSASKSYQIPGNMAFELYDTYGFPIDLTQLMANEIGWTVDMKGFEEALQQQKSRSRAATAIDSEDWITLIENPISEFIGYDSLEAKTKISKYRKVKTKGKEVYQIVLEATPFYAESGGQVGDSGSLSFGEGWGEVEIIDTKKENNLIIHFTEKLPTKFDEVFAKVDAKKRKQTEIHHSATHLLHAALRKVLGTHVAQKGSLVNAEHLRFDFSHFAKMIDEEIAAVEKIVNEKIRENIPVVIKELPKEEALKLGAMALFGEKYGDIVRVVIIDPTYSVELCGGTHVGATGELGFFKLTHESAVAAGVRRVEAVAGKASEALINREFQTTNTIREALKNPKDLTKAVENILSENAELKKHIEHLEARQLVVLRNELLQKDEIVNQINFIGSIVEVSNADALKKLCFDLKNHLRDFVVVLCANIGGKPFTAVSIADNVVAAKNLDASKIIKEHIAPLIKGGGGGQKTLATAGGTDASNLQEVIAKVKSLL